MEEHPLGDGIIWGDLNASNVVWGDLSTSDILRGDNVVG
jgi:hypothetical protein